MIVLCSAAGVFLVAVTDVTIRFVRVLREVSHSQVNNVVEALIEKDEMRASTSDPPYSGSVTTPANNWPRL